VFLDDFGRGFRLRRIVFLQQKENKNKLILYKKIDLNKQT